MKTQEPAPLRYEPFYNSFSFKTTKTLLNCDESCCQKISKIFFTIIFDITLRNPASLVFENIFFCLTSVALKRNISRSEKITTAFFLILGCVYLYCIPTIASVLLQTIFFKEKIAFQITLEMLYAINAIIFLYIAHPYIKFFALNSEDNPIIDELLNKFFPSKPFWNALENANPANFPNHALLGKIVMCGYFLIKNSVKLTFFNIIKIIMYRNKSSFLEKTFSLFVIFSAIYIYKSIIPIILFKILLTLVPLIIAIIFFNIVCCKMEFNYVCTGKNINELEEIRKTLENIIIMELENIVIMEMAKEKTLNDVVKLEKLWEKLKAFMEPDSQPFFETDPNEELLDNIQKFHCLGNEYPGEDSSRDFMDESLARLSHCKWCTQQGEKLPSIFWIAQENENVNRDSFNKKINDFRFLFHSDKLDSNKNNLKKVQAFLLGSSKSTDIFNIYNTLKKLHPETILEKRIKQLFFCKFVFLLPFSSLFYSLSKLLFNNGSISKYCLPVTQFS